MQQNTLKQQNVLKQWISPKHCYHLLDRWFSFSFYLSVFLLLLGLYQGLFIAPADYQQGDGFRIIYIHVPSAFWSLGIYSIMFLLSVIYLIWRIKIADWLAHASASIGAGYTLIALISGALWGKPMWGAFWVWDARLTSELILFFIYWGYMALRSAITDQKIGARFSAIFCIIGMADIPIVHFSVKWWNTLHQGATLSQFAKPAIANEMLWPLLIMFAGFGLFYFSIAMRRLKTEILIHEAETDWMRKIG